MSDTQPPPVPDLDPVLERLALLEASERDHRDHRTKVQTLLTLASAAALVVILGAVSVRDTALSTSSRVLQLEARADHVDAVATRREADDRSTREAIVRLQTTMETLQSGLFSRLDAIDSRLLQRAPASR